MTVSSNRIFETHENRANSREIFFTDLVGPWEDEDGTKTGHFIVAGYRDCKDCNDTTTVLGPPLTGPPEELTSMCLRFNFTFQRLDKVELFTYSPDTGELVLWKLTKEDKHSIPEGVWIKGQVLVRKDKAIQDQDYWLGLTTVMNDDPLGYVAFDDFDIEILSEGSGLATNSIFLLFVKTH